MTELRKTSEASGPKQERGWRSLARIVGTARELFAERDPRDVSLREIGDEADVSMSTLFARFPKKEDLLEYLHTEFCEERLAEAERLLEDFVARELSLEEIVRESTAYLFDLGFERQGLERTFRSSSRSEVIANREQRFQGQRVRMLTRFVADRFGGVTVLSEEDIASLIRLALTAPDTTEEPSPEDAERLAGMVIQLSRVSAPLIARPGRGAFVDMGARARERLLAAGLQALDGRDLASVSEQEISQRAGTDVAAFQAHFGSKIAFLHAMLDACGKEIVSTVDALVGEWRGESLEDLVREAIRQYVVLRTKYGGVLETALLAERSDPELGRRHAALDERLESVVMNLARQLVPSFAIEPGAELDVRRRIQAVASSIRSALSRPDLFHLEGGSTEERIVDEITRLALDLLQVTPDR